MEWVWWLVAAIIVVLAVVAGIWLSVASRSLAALASAVDESWEQIAAKLRSRAELVPELVTTVQGYAAHEKDAFARAEAGRAAALAADTPPAAAAADAKLQDGLRGLLSVAEGYPQLQASQGFLQLQSRLAGAEDGIQAARRAYNGGVRELNTKLRSFPSSLFAKRVGAAPRDFFEVTAASAVAEPPRIQF